MIIGEGFFRVAKSRDVRRSVSVIVVGTALACGFLTSSCSSGPSAARSGTVTPPVNRPQDSTVRSAAVPAGVVPGIDVSAYQQHISWTVVKAEGAKFAYVKATEGTRYKSSAFSAQYAGSRKAGLAHGAYHFATPNTSSAVSQADFFVANGGAAKVDGHTLPGVLDIEKNPYGKDPCYGMSHAAMNTWISAFLHEYHARTGRRAVINTFRDWWISCTGDAGAKPGSVFGATYPLWVNDHQAHVPNVPIPSAWKSYTVWQWTDKGPYGDEDYIRSATVFKSLLAK